MTVSKILSPIDAFSQTSKKREQEALLELFFNSIIDRNRTQFEILKEQVLQKIGHLDMQDENGNTALILACSNSRFNDKTCEVITQTLLEQGANPNLQDKEGTTALQALLMYDFESLPTQKKLISLLLKFKARLDLTDYFKRLPQHFILIQRHPRHSAELLEFLMSKGIDLDAKGFKGNTLLHQATRHGNDADVGFLLSKNVNPNILNDGSNAPLHWASFYGHLNIVKLLVKSGADINAPGQDLETPLFNAFNKGHVGIFKFLLKKGASLVAIDEKGRDLFSSHISPNINLQTFYEQVKYDMSFPKNSTKTLTARI